MFRSYREGRGEVEGFADDYAFVIQGLLDLYEASFDPGWLKFALELQGQMDALFWDNESGGYFTVTGHDSNILLRLKEDNDSAEPAASSVAALNLARLAAIRNDGELLARAKKTVNAFARQLAHFPSALPQMLVAFDFLEGSSRQIVIAGDSDSPETKALLAEVHRHFLPNKVLLLADGAEGQRYLGEKNEAIRAMSMVDGKPAAYVCENFACKAPVTDVDEFRDLLTSYTLRTFLSDASSRSWTFEDCFGETPKPTRETRALPGRERHPAKCRRAERAEFARYSPSREVISGSFFRRKRSQLFQVFRMLSRGVR